MGAKGGTSNHVPTLSGFALDSKGFNSPAGTHLHVERHSFGGDCRCGPVAVGFSSKQSVLRSVVGPKRLKRLAGGRSHCPIVSRKQQRRVGALFDGTHEGRRQSEVEGKGAVNVLDPMSDFTGCSPICVAHERADVDMGLKLVAGKDAVDTEAVESI